MKKHLTAGIDVGTSSVKVVVARSDAGNDGELLSCTYQRIRRRNVVDVARAAYDEACAAAGVASGDFDYVCTTGDADTVDFVGAPAPGGIEQSATGHLYGMTTHARGALHLLPEARAALDLGALHARALKIDERGRVLHHRMTSQCASGTGQFLESIARYLGVPLDDVGELSCRSSSGEQTSSICAVLAETDVINMVSRGISTEDILKGIHLSIARRLTKLLRSIHAGGVVALTGGMAHDRGLVRTLEEVIAEEEQKKRPGQGKLVVASHERSIYAGAIGAALLGAKRFNQLKQRERAA